MSSLYLQEKVYLMSLHIRGMSFQEEGADISLVTVE